MTFVSGYRMILNLFELELIYKPILCNTMVLSSTINIVYRVWSRNATITDCRPTHGLVQALTVQYRYISSSYSFQKE